MVIVAGGGIGGLSAAYYLAQKYGHTNIKCILLEASKRCGGWLNSTQNSEYLFEIGPRTIRPKGRNGMNTLNLLEDIGLSNKIAHMKPDHPAALNRLIYANKKLNVLPSSIFGAFIKTPPFSASFARYFLNDLFAKKKDLKDDSLYNFVHRRFSQEVADYAMSPVLCGICAGDAKEISVKLLMKDYFEYEQMYGGVIKGSIKHKKVIENYELSGLAQIAALEQWSIYTLEGGLEQLAIRLGVMLDACGVQTLKEHKIEQISFHDDNKKVCVKINDDCTFSSEHLFSCIPAYELAPLLKNNHPQLSDELEQIPFVDVAVVNLQFKSAKLQHQAFGFLIPPLEKVPILGVIFDSCCFPEFHQGTVLTAMMGGRWFKEYFGDNPTEEIFLEVALKHIKDILGIDEKPDNFKVSILRKCIPQYLVGHYERVERIREYIKENKLPISLCGSSYDGVGINDAILSSKLAVDNINLVE